MAKAAAEMAFLSESIVFGCSTEWCSAGFLAYTWNVEVRSRIEVVMIGTWGAKESTGGVIDNEPSNSGERKWKRMVDGIDEGYTQRLLIR